MERTTVYLDKPLKNKLLDFSYRETKRTGKRIGAAEIIRTAVNEYLKKVSVLREVSVSVEKKCQ